MLPTSKSTPVLPPLHAWHAHTHTATRGDRRAPPHVQSMQSYTTLAKLFPHPPIHTHPTRSRSKLFPPLNPCPSSPLTCIPPSLTTTDVAPLLSFQHQRTTNQYNTMASAAANIAFRDLTPAQLRQWVEDHPGHIEDWDSKGHTALHTGAAGMEDLALILWMIDTQGADVNGRTRTGVDRSPFCSFTPDRPCLAGAQCGPYHHCHQWLDRVDLAGLSRPPRVRRLPAGGPAGGGFDQRCLHRSRGIL